MKEVIRLCSNHRQTMLFSATMTEEVGQAAEGRKLDRSLPSLLPEITWTFFLNLFW